MEWAEWVTALQGGGSVKFEKGFHLFAQALTSPLYLVTIGSKYTYSLAGTFYPILTGDS